MPNWCYNNLNISGTKEDMTKFYNALSIKLESNMDGDTVEKEGVRLFDFNDFVEMPEELGITSGSKTNEAVACIKAESFDDWTEIDRYLGWDAWTEKANVNPEDELSVRRQTMLDHCLGELSKVDFENGLQFLENVKAYGAGTWYDWCCNNWGTKWNACSVYVHHAVEDEVCLTFETAWSPPIPVIEALIEQNPDLCVEMEYSEEGMGFAGRIRSSNGLVTDENAEIRYSSDCCNADMQAEGWTEKAEELKLEEYENCPKCHEECEQETEFIY